MLIHIEGEEGKEPRCCLPKYKKFECHKKENSRDLESRSVQILTMLYYTMMYGRQSWTFVKKVKFSLNVCGVGGCIHHN